MAAVDLDEAVEQGAQRARSSVPRRISEWVNRHPLVTVALLAGVVRVGVVVVIAVSTDAVVISDESQYIALARWLADGRDPAQFALGFGRSLLNLTPIFIRPLGWFTAVLGEARVAGSLMVAAYAVLTAVLATWLAMRVIARRGAVLAGAVVALMPSQILFSSVVLRESLVWAACAAVGVAVALANRTQDQRRLLWSAALAGVGLLYLGWLRDQVLIAAAWALVPGVLFGMREGRWRRAVGALVLALTIPVVGGIGVGGFSLMERLVPQLGTLRTNFSMSANTAFTDTTLVTGPTTTTLLGRPAAANPGGQPGEATATTTTTAQPASGHSFVVGYEGEVYSVDESASASLKALPRGLLAVLFRPWPWERPRSSEMSRARLENIAWYGVYVLALVGFATAWRRHRSVLAYPAILALGLVGSAAVTQGNLGTAFRHRGELLWILAVFAALGAERVLGAVRDRSLGVGTSARGRSHA